MVRFIRKVWMNSRGHCGLAIPVEIYSELARDVQATERCTGIDCSLELVDGSLVVSPVRRS